MTNLLTLDTATASTQWREKNLLGGIKYSACDEYFEGNEPNRIIHKILYEIWLQWKYPNPFPLFGADKAMKQFTFFNN